MLLLSVDNVAQCARWVRTLVRFCAADLAWQQLIIPLRERIGPQIRKKTETRIHGFRCLVPEP